MNIIECVPNISEGKNKTIIQEIANSIKNTKGVQLLNIDSGEAANRTVFTYIGESRAVFNATRVMIEKATELIDMSKHQGEHPRIGAVDVCPFIPIQGITKENLTRDVHKFAKEISEQFRLPIFLYEYNSNQEYRKKLEQIRQGEYEGLASKLKDSKWEPNFGTSDFNSKFGAMVMGVRNYLIAYNINLQTKDVSIAQQIAKEIRESGSITKSDTMGVVRRPGCFKNVKAIGWFITDFDCAQVSTNLTDFTVTSIFEVFEKVKILAIKYGTKVNGSELIGMLPYDAFKQCGDFYAGNSPEKEALNIATEALGLNSIKPFELNEQILEIKAGLMERL